MEALAHWGGHEPEATDWSFDGSLTVHLLVVRCRTDPGTVTLVSVTHDDRKIPLEAVHNFRKNLQIEMYDLQNELVMTINVYNAWPSKLTIADFDAKANELAIEHIELQNEGWDLTPGSPPDTERPAK